MQVLFPDGTSSCINYLFLLYSLYNNIIFFFHSYQCKSFKEEIIIKNILRKFLYRSSQWQHVRQLRIPTFTQMVRIPFKIKTVLFLLGPLSPMVLHYWCSNSSFYIHCTQGKLAKNEWQAQAFPTQKLDQCGPIPTSPKGSWEVRYSKSQTKWQR